MNRLANWIRNLYRRAQAVVILSVILDLLRSIVSRLASLDAFIRKQFPDVPGYSGTQAERAQPARLAFGPDTPELAGIGAVVQSKVLPDDKMLPVRLVIPTTDRGGEPIVNENGSPWVPVGRIESDDEGVIAVEDNPNAPPAAFDEIVKRLRTPHVGATVVRFVSGPFPDGSEQVTEVAFAVPNSAPGEAVIKFGTEEDEPAAEEPVDVPPGETPDTPPGA